MILDIWLNVFMCWVGVVGLFLILFKVGVLCVCLGDCDYVLFLIARLFDSVGYSY